MTAAGVDCHAHIIDPKRFPVPPGRGYKPTPEETGTREEFAAVIDAHGIGRGLLVQLSGYGTDNRVLLDAIAAYPGRLKAIAVIDPSITDRALEDLTRGGVVGVRFNLPSYDPEALVRQDAPKLLARIRSLGWFAQVYADDAQWHAAAPVLRASNVSVLVDHLGVRDLARGTGQKGFQEVLSLGKEGRAVVKLSGIYRISGQKSEFTDVDPFVEQLIAAFGVERCVWGSDWPFINTTLRPSYADQLAPLRRWLPDAADRAKVLAANPLRLFKFEDVP
jgi:predicted TIM-barrel fold metal-dependent hydrolase